MEELEDKIFSMFDEYEQTVSSSNSKQVSEAETRAVPTSHETSNVPEIYGYYKGIKRGTKEYYKVIRKEAKKENAEKKRFDRKKQKNVEKVSKQISKSMAKKLKKADNMSYLRLTPPKGKRNIITRIRHRSHYDKGDYDYIEENIQNGYITPDTIASGEVTKKEWKELQAYEDAREDVTVKKNWNRFKALIATVAIIGSIAFCKNMYDGIQDSFETSSVVSTEMRERASLENRAKHALHNFTDQQLLYDYTDGEITEANWEALPENVKEYIRNPVTAAEAAYKYGNDLSHFYLMVDGDFTTETWEKLPEEIRQFVREPVSTAKEYFENGKDQRFLYEVSRGRLTEEFWNELPAEIKQYVRNPIELAKEFERQGDDLGYLENLSQITNKTELSRSVWNFLPEELKEHVVDPKLVIDEDELQTEVESGEQVQENDLDLER